MKEVVSLLQIAGFGSADQSHASAGYYMTWPLLLADGRMAKVSVVASAAMETLAMVKRVATG